MAAALHAKRMRGIWVLEFLLANDLQCLDTMGQRGASANGVGHVKGLGDFGFVAALLQTGVRIGVNAVRALHGGSHG